MFELIQGAARSGRAASEVAKERRFVEAGSTAVDFTSDDGGSAGRLRADLSSRGLMIGAYDLLIAGHALARGWMAVTADTRESARDGARPGRLDDRPDVTLAVRRGWWPWLDSA